MGKAFCFCGLDENWFLRLTNLLLALAGSSRFPTTENEWRNIADDFEKRCNCPNCLGAVDGKHVNIKPLTGSGSYFYNYKGAYSLVLLAVVNANYEFIMCDFGINSRISDGGVIEYSQFYRKLKDRKLSIPPPTRTMNSKEALPFVFISDEAFALRYDFLKPFSQRDWDHDKKIFNYRLSRARMFSREDVSYLANIFLPEVNETRGGALTHIQQMEVFLRRREA
ncbi:unnamed protein product [Acanthoscelides obtectus]|uniref:DDE Tnp4 domain-containing protein n=1 Tax=Acanthoscelides obtectus TaxID=200917 RepID=A0A9P0P3N8_ACAOB|nr:unnamed protein product [Acanthoscelides obtectus]